MEDSKTAGPRRSRARALALACVSAFVLSCGGEGSAEDAGAPEREPGELALPPSANAPRVMRESSPPDTLQPEPIEEFAILGSDSSALVDVGSGGFGPALSIDAISDSYRGHYAAALSAEGSAVRNRIDRELQEEAERRTARDRGFAGWNDMIGALTPEQRARLVDRLNEANVELARDLHGSAGPAEPEETAPEG